MSAPIKRKFLFLKTIDSYVLKEYLKLLAYCLIAFTFILLSLDIFDNMASFTQSKRPDAMNKALLFFSLKLFINLNEVCPLAILFACIFQIIKMAISNEVIALLGSGVRPTRIVSPIYIFALFVSISVMLLNLSIFPRFLSITFHIFNYDKGKLTTVYRSVVYQSNDAERTWFIEAFTDSNKIDGVRIKKYNPEGFLTMELNAKKASYSDKNGWVFNNVEMQIFKKQTLGADFTSYIPDTVEKFNVLDKQNKFYDLIGKITETPIDIQDVCKSPYELSSIRILKNLENPNLDERYRSAIKTQFYRRLAFPFLSIFFIMIMAPYLILNDRTSLARKIYMCFGFLMVYFILQKICELMGNIELMPPFFAGILPTLVIASWALVINMRDFNMASKSSRKKQPA